jgi:AraC-like DNA-binding protein
MHKYIASNEFWDTVCTVFLPDNPRNKDVLHFNKEYVNMSLNYFSTGLGITYASFLATFFEDTIMEGINNADFSFLCFNVGHDLCMKEKENRVNFESRKCWSGKEHCGHKLDGVYCKNRKYVSHYIMFTNELFENIVASNEELVQSDLVYRSSSIDVYFNNHITQRQEALLNELLSISCIEDKLQELYLESKLLDLIYITMNEMKTKEHNDISLSHKDVECLHKAKNILLNNIHNPPSLKELAYKSAINEFKLKKGFKQLFGNTAYGILQEYRLNKAKTLLQTNEINISEASSLVGYKSISHFSKIFKEHFGVTPIQIKKESRIYY